MNGGFVECCAYPAAKVFEIENLSGADCQSAATINYLDSGKAKTKGVVNKTFRLEGFNKAPQSIKAIIICDYTVYFLSVALA